MQPAILIACPTYQGMKYCINEFIQRLNQLTYPNYDILIVDNSNTLDYYNYLKIIKLDNLLNIIFFEFFNYFYNLF